MAAKKKRKKAKRSAKSSKKRSGRIPLNILERRAAYLNTLVESRGGTVRMGGKKPRRKKAKKKSGARRKGKR
jgi:hypothetical protein